MSACIAFAASVSARRVRTSAALAEGISERAMLFAPAVGATSQSICFILSNSSVTIAFSKLLCFIVDIYKFTKYVCFFSLRLAFERVI